MSRSRSVHINSDKGCGNKLKVDISEKPRRVTFSETSEGEIVSLVELIIIPDVFGQRPAGYIHKIYTDEKYQGKGLATKLVNDAIRCAEKSGCHKVFLITTLENVKFYEGLGFEADQCGLVRRFE